MILDATDEWYADRFWDDFDCLELVMLMGMYTRSVAKLQAQLAYRRDQPGTEELFGDLYVELHKVYGTLCHKASIISEANQFVHETRDLRRLGTGWVSGSCS